MSLIFSILLIVYQYISLKLCSNKIASSDRNNMSNYYFFFITSFWTDHYFNSLGLLLNISFGKEEDPHQVFIYFLNKAATHHCHGELSCCLAAML